MIHSSPILDDPDYWLAQNEQYLDQVEERVKQLLLRETTTSSADEAATLADNGQINQGAGFGDAVAEKHWKSFRQGDEAIYGNLKNFTSGNNNDDNNYQNNGEDFFKQVEESFLASLRKSYPYASNNNSNNNTNNNGFQEWDNRILPSVPLSPMEEPVHDQQQEQGEEEEKKILFDFEPEQVEKTFSNITSNRVSNSSSPTLSSQVALPQRYKIISIGDENEDNSGTSGTGAGGLYSTLKELSERIQALEKERETIGKTLSTLSSVNDEGTKNTFIVDSSSRDSLLNTADICSLPISFESRFLFDEAPVPPPPANSQSKGNLVNNGNSSVTSLLIGAEKAALPPHISPLKRLASPGSRQTNSNGSPSSPLRQSYSNPIFTSPPPPPSPTLVQERSSSEVVESNARSERNHLISLLQKELALEQDFQAKLKEQNEMLENWLQSTGNSTAKKSKVVENKRIESKTNNVKITNVNKREKSPVQQEPRWEEHVSVKKKQEVKDHFDNSASSQRGNVKSGAASSSTINNAATTTSSSSSSSRLKNENNKSESGIPFLVGKSISKSHSNIAHQQSQHFARKQQRTNAAPHTNTGASTNTSNNVSRSSSRNGDDSRIVALEDELSNLHRQYQGCLERYAECEGDEKLKYESALSEILKSMQSKGKQLLAIKSLLERQM